MERIAVLVASSPSAPAAQRAFQLVRDLAAKGHQVTLGLLEDAVLGGTGTVPGVPLQECAAVLVLADDLSLRGVDPAHLDRWCSSCTYGDLIDQVMARSDRVMGAF